MSWSGRKRRTLARSASKGGVLRALAGALLALAVAELVIRYFYDVHYVYDPELGYLHAPGTMRRTGEAPPAVSTWTVGGLRRARLPDEARPRILVLGDSFTEAAMINDGEVYTDLLEVALPQFQFLNAGRTTLSMADYVAFAQTYERRFHPTWTIVQLNVDDLGADAFDKSDRSSFSLSSNGELELHKVIPPHKHGPTYWIRERSMLAYFIRLRYREYRLVASAAPPLFRGAIAAPTPPATRDYPIEELLDRTADSYEKRITFAIIAPYVPHAPDDVSAAERRMMAHCMARGYSCVSTRVGYRRFSETGRAPFGFATSSFNEGHLNAAGHALLARVIAEELRRLHALL
jgi:hypothetical protein